jgi:RNA polymerase sigma-70 factor (ECF subfamily)
MIAHSRAVDRLRSDGAYARRSLAWNAMTAALWDPVAEEIQDDHERRQLRTVLGGLTDLQREAVLLAFYGEHTYRQVAIILGVTEGTINSRTRDAVTRLRAAMSDTDGNRPPAPVPSAPAPHFARAVAERAVAGPAAHDVAR